MPIQEPDYVCDLCVPPGVQSNPANPQADPLPPHNFGRIEDPTNTNFFNFIEHMAQQDHPVLVCCLEHPAHAGFICGAYWLSQGELDAHLVNDHP